MTCLTHRLTFFTVTLNRDDYWVAGAYKAATDLTPLMLRMQEGVNNGPIEERINGNKKERNMFKVHVGTMLIRVDGYDTSRWIVVFDDSNHLNGTFSCSLGMTIRLSASRTNRTLKK